jgi:putrescine importer
MKYLVLPTIGFCIIVSLWLDLNEHSLLFGGSGRHLACCTWAG